jgi:galactokinase
MSTALENELEKKFISAFGSDGEIIKFFSPGRVNLIGEHIDYNGGFVFPAALSIGIYAAVRFKENGNINLRSLNSDISVSVDPAEEISYEKKDSWGNYPKGVLKYLKEDGYILKPCDILFSGNLPEEAGLSSSACLEVLTGFIIMFSNGKIDRKKLALTGKRVENEFIGVNSGIMDQFSIANGKKENAMLLNCETLEFRYVPFKLEGFTLVIINSNVRRELAASKYNERRKECDEVMEILRRHKEIINLVSADLSDVIKYVKDEKLQRRARHVITENKRVLEAVEMMNNGDIPGFGKLLNESHESLKNDYEVTGFNLDTIAGEALKIEGCIGARMTGAGFGGCAIALVKNESVNSFIEILGNKYLKITDLKAAFYISRICDGVNKI